MHLDLLVLTGLLEAGKFGGVSGIGGSGPGGGVVHNGPFAGAGNGGGGTRTWSNPATAEFGQTQAGGGGGGGWFTRYPVVLFHGGSGIVIIAYPS